MCYLTREQLGRLAELHGRTLPDDDEPEEQPHVPFAVYKLLEECLGTAEEALHVGEQVVASLQEGLAQAQGRLSQVKQHVGNLTPWAKLLEGLAAWMAQIETQIKGLTHALEQPDHR